MEDSEAPVEQHQNKIKSLPRNVWAVSLTSFFMDISSEMVINILPLFLANVLGVQTSIIGMIEGVAEATASILKVFSGWLSDKLGGRKWIAVAGYGISALAKPFFYFANTWGMVAGVRWADRVGQGCAHCTAGCPGVADSIEPEQRGPGLRLSSRGRHRRRRTGTIDRCVGDLAGPIQYGGAGRQYLQGPWF